MKTNGFATRCSQLVGKMIMNNTNKHSNGSADHHSDNEDNSNPEIATIINCVLNVPLMLISILSNALVLAAIIRTPSIRSTLHMIMLCSLAVSDFLVGLVAQPINIAKQLTEDRIVYYVVLLTGPSLCVVSLMTITAITVDRFLALHYHMRNATLVTESRVKYTLTIIWLISFHLSGFAFWNPRVHNFVVAIVSIIYLLICMASYIGIYIFIYIFIPRLKRSAMNTFVFFIVLIICYLPLYVLLTHYGLSMNWQTEWEFALTAVYMNSSINPFLYCLRLRELRTAVVKTARQMLCKQTEEN